jgi:hypothetical protein
MRRVPPDGGMQQMKTVEFAGSSDLFNGREPSASAVSHGDSNSTIEGDDWGRLGSFERPIKSGRNPMQPSEQLLGSFEYFLPLEWLP